MRYLKTIGRVLSVPFVFVAALAAVIYLTLTHDENNPTP